MCFMVLGGGRDSNAYFRGVSRVRCTLAVKKAKHGIVYDIYMLIPLCAQYNFIMRNGIPICEIFSDPRPFAYGDPHMHTAIPICKIMHMGIQN